MVYISFLIMLNRFSCAGMVISPMNFATYVDDWERCYFTPNLFAQRRADIVFLYLGAAKFLF